MRFSSVMLALSLVLGLACNQSRAQFVGSGFTYQGELRQAGSAATGNFDFRFTLFGSDTGGSPIGTTLARNNVAVAGGLFQTELDFGSTQFALGDQQWLQIEVRPAGVGSFETLLPRTKLTATPFALQSLRALPNSINSLSVLDGSLQGSDLSGASIGIGEINANQVQARVVGVCSTGNAIRSISSTGAVTCEATAANGLLGLSAGTGINLTGSASNPIVGISAGGVGANEINSAQVQARVSSTCLTPQFIRAVNQDGTVSCATPSTPSDVWQLGGNAGTPLSAFLGTTDAAPLTLKVRNQVALTLQPTLPLNVDNQPIAINVVGGISFVPPSIVRGATIAGGGTAAIDPDFGFGDLNRVTDHYGSIGGGSVNQAGNGVGGATDAAFANVAGGSRNIASGLGASVGGGDRNLAQTTYSTVSGGQLNQASGQFSSVTGGQGNSAPSPWSMAAGGFNNCAGGDFSFAGGRNAKVRYGATALLPSAGCNSAFSALDAGTPSGDIGTFIWADSQFTDFVSTGPDQFLVRASGGVGLNSNTIPAPVDLLVSGKNAGNADLFIRPKDWNIGFNFGVQASGGSSILYIARWDGSGAYNDLASFNTDDSFQVYGNAIKPGGGSWSVPSDRRFKEDIEPLDNALDRMLALRGVQFHYRKEIPEGYFAPGAQSGFIAQEVEQVFPDWVQEDDQGYKLVGPRGFEALTVEAMRELKQQHEAEIEALRGAQAAAAARQQAEIAALRAQLEVLMARIPAN